MLSDFSSGGPTLDGRLKPDCVAPGEQILSAQAHVNKPLSDKCDPPFKPEVEDDPSSLEGLFYLEGTSMSTPVVSGTVALLRQYFEEGWYPTGTPTQGNELNPTSALIKAVLLNGAQPLIGLQYSLSPMVQTLREYDPAQGFGRISLVDSLKLKKGKTVDLLACDDMLLNDTDSHEFDILIDTSNANCFAEELSATLAWIDPPAKEGCMHCVLNDLDLSITSSDGSELFFPNGLNSTDTKNNVERIRIAVTNGEIFKIRVNATNLSSTSQRYSLAVTGCLASETTCTPLPLQSTPSTQINSEDHGSPMQPFMNVTTSTVPPQQTTPSSQISDTQQNSTVSPTANYTHSSETPTFKVPPPGKGSPWRSVNDTQNGDSLTFTLPPKKGKFDKGKAVKRGTLGPKKRV